MSCFCHVEKYCVILPIGSFKFDYNIGKLENFKLLGGLPHISFRAEWETERVGMKEPNSKRWEPVHISWK